MKTYEVIAPATGLIVGESVTDDDLAKNHPGLGDAERLVSIGALREADARGAEKPASKKADDKSAKK